MKKEYIVKEKVKFVIPKGTEVLKNKTPFKLISTAYFNKDEKSEQLFTANALLNNVWTMHDIEINIKRDCIITTSNSSISLIKENHYFPLLKKYCARKKIKIVD